MKQLLNSLFFSAVLILGVALLIAGYIGDTAFVAFITVGGTGVAIYTLLPSITEFSIGGNSVKLKEKLNEAERITGELRQIRMVAVRTTLKFLKIRPNSNFLLYKNIIEFRNVYQIISGEEAFDTDYLTLVTETILTLREHVFEYVDLNVRVPLSHGIDWRDENIKSYIRSLGTEQSLTSRERMSVFFANQYLLLSEFVNELNKGRRPELKILNPDKGWHVIFKDPKCDGV